MVNETDAIPTCLKYSMLLSVELCPTAQNSYVEVLIPGTSECDLILELGSLKKYQVKMRPLELALI